MKVTRVVITGLTWTIAAGLLSASMSGGAHFLMERGFSPLQGWTIAACVDLGFAVALLADNTLSSYGKKVGWGAALRWLAGAAALGLNAGSPLLAGLWVEAALHSLPPFFAMVVIEAATSYQRVLAGLANTSEASVPAEQVSVPAAGSDTKREVNVPDGMQLPVTAGQTENVSSGQAPIPVSEMPASSPVRERESAAAEPVVSRSCAVVSRKSAGWEQVDKKQKAREFWLRERAAGRVPSGAELDRVAGTSDYGRKLRRRWLVEEEKAPQSARAGELVAV